MSININKVYLAGRLTRDPELRETPGGTSVCNFVVATNRRFKTSSNEVRDEATFVDIEVWGRQAENCAEYLQKGSEVFIDGRLKLETWEGKEDGQKRSRMRVVGESVTFLGRRGDKESNDGV